MANTGLAQDERFQRHLTGAGHPERPQRLAQIGSVLRERGIEQACKPVEIVPIDMELVHRIHEQTYVERFRQACSDRRPYIDTPDSGICPESYEIAQLAAGTVIRAVDDVMAGRLDNAFCPVRPPGHHAEFHRSMGFCMFNNIALAARRLLDDHGLTRVLVFDFDVHHGNGTQHTFEEDDRVLFVSLHGHPRFVYPGTGYEHERGRGKAAGLTVNVPMLPGSGDEDYRRAFEHPVLPAIEKYRPQFVLISAGFDAHRADPLAPLELETESYGWMTDAIITIAKAHAEGRILSILEGGYDLDALGDSVSLHVTRLLSA
jgi:acetoin utilization deacetylase AcuC-like enzyme